MAYKDFVAFVLIVFIVYYINKESISIPYARRDCTVTGQWLVEHWYAGPSHASSDSDAAVVAIPGVKPQTRALQAHA